MNLKSEFFKWHAKEIVVISLAAVFTLTMFQSCKVSQQTNFKPGRSVHQTGQGHKMPCAK